MRAPCLGGLYAITPETHDSDWLAQRVEQALRGGARALQYRSKLADAKLRREQALRLRQICTRYRSLMIVNDDVELAAVCGADGVHLGRDDTPIAQARRGLPHAALIGVSCYDELARARQAAHAGADYLAFGSFFPSRVKPGAVRASLDLLREARRDPVLAERRVALVAIGGIDLANAAEVIEAGADAIAVISALFHAPDTLAAARALSSQFGRECGTD
jgi:thiamine-phosphate pyrophosphorylase